MYMLPHIAIVIHHRSGVDEDILSDPGPPLDQRPSVNLRTLLQDNPGGDASVNGDERRESKSPAAALFEYPDARSRISNGSDPVGQRHLIGGPFSEDLVSSQSGNSIEERTRIVGTQKTQDSVAPFLQKIQDNPGMPTTSQEKEGQRARGSRPRHNPAPQPPNTPPSIPWAIAPCRDA